MEVSQEIKKGKVEEKSYYSWLKRKEEEAELSKFDRKSGRESQIGDSIHQKLVGTVEGKKKIAEMKSDVKQKEQSRERISIKEKLEANKRLLAEREKERKHSRYRDQEISR